MVSGAKAEPEQLEKEGAHIPHLGGELGETRQATVRCRLDNPILATFLLVLFEPSTFFFLFNIFY